MIRDNESRKDSELRKIRYDLRKSIDNAFAKALLRNAIIMNKEDESLLLSIAADYTKLIHSDVFQY